MQERTGDRLHHLRQWMASADKEAGRHRHIATRSARSFVRPRRVVDRRGLVLGEHQEGGEPRDDQPLQRAERVSHPCAGERSCAPLSSPKFWVLSSGSFLDLGHGLRNPASPTAHIPPQPPGNRPSSYLLTYLLLLSLLLTLTLTYLLTYSSTY